MFPSTLLKCLYVTVNNIVSNTKLSKDKQNNHSRILHQKQDDWNIWPKHVSKRKKYLEGKQIINLIIHFMYIRSVHEMFIHFPSIVSPNCPRMLPSKQLQYSYISSVNIFVNLILLKFSKYLVKFHLIHKNHFAIPLVNF